MLRAALGSEVVDHYVHTAKWEQFEYDRRVTDWELKRGFERSLTPAEPLRLPCGGGHKGEVTPHRAR
jgi:hypothetical protein